MLENSKAYSGFAVDDIDKAKEFHGETLGLKTSVLVEDADPDRPRGGPADADLQEARFRAGHLHDPQFPGRRRRRGRRRAGAARGDLRALRRIIEQDEKGIDRGDEGPTIAWFTDPAGNILAVHGQSTGKPASKLSAARERALR